MTLTLKSKGYMSHVKLEMFFFYVSASVHVEIWNNQIDWLSKIDFLAWETTVLISLFAFIFDFQSNILKENGNKQTLYCGQFKITLYSIGSFLLAVS